MVRLAPEAETRGLVTPTMQRGITTVLTILFLATAALNAQDAGAAAKPDKAEAKGAEATAKPAEKKADGSTPLTTGPLDDFEKQLQKELEGSPDRATTSAEQPSVFWQFVRTLITLAFLLGLFYGIFRLYKFRRELPQQNFSAISSIYEYPLGTNQRLQILEIAGKLMILGVSDNSVQLISEVTDKYTIDRIKLDCAEDSKQTRTDFLSELSRAIKTNIADRFGKKGPMNFTGSGGEKIADNLEAQRQSSMERLRKLKSEKFDWQSAKRPPADWRQKP